MSAALSGHVYLVCFDRAIGDPDNPKGSASHYLGWAEDVEARMAEHGAPASWPPASSEASPSTWSAPGPASTATSSAA